MTNARLILLGMLFGVAACSSASPKFLNTTPQTLSVEGWEIDVYWRGTDAQAIRTNTVWGASKQDMQIRAAVAMEEVTGCRVDRRSLNGDAAVMNARLIC